MSIGQNIRKIRELKDMTQDWVASQLGISQNAYSKIEREETDVPFSRLQQIAQLFKVEVMDIVGFDEKKFFLNIYENKDQSNNGFIVVNGVSEKERELYEQVIAQLRSENTYLKKLLDSYVRN